jgi:hypothetical protein
MHASTRLRAGLALSAALALAVVPATGAFATAPTAPRAVAFIDAHGYPTVQAALDASHDGDTVTVSPGTFPGGIRIAHSVNVRGAGAGRTVFRGGEHVITVGTADAPAGTEPHVTIAGVTVTGGFAHTDAWPGDPAAEGAGIYVLPDANGEGGALTLTDTVVTGNRTEPTVLAPGAAIGADLSQYAWDDDDGYLRGEVCPERRFCDYAGSFGAGISSYGDVTLVRTSVVGNAAAGGLTSNAWGGGIVMWSGTTLTATDSHIDRNSARAIAPHGRHAEGGGVFTGYEVALHLTRTTVTANAAELDTDFPLSYWEDYPEEYQPLYTDLRANGAGIHASLYNSVEIRGSHIDGNRLVFDSPNGANEGRDAAIHTNATTRFDIANSTINGNSSDLRILDGQYTGAWGGIVGWDTDGTLDHVSIANNTSTVTASNGLAWVSAAVQTEQATDGWADTGSTTIADSVIAGNRAIARSPHGGGVVNGAGLISITDTTLLRTAVTGNVGSAHVADASTTVLLGGGIENDADSVYPGWVGYDASLTLRDSAVTGNSLTSSLPGARISGGGIHSLAEVTLHGTTVRGNAPDDCDACAGHPSPHPAPHPLPPHHAPTRIDPPHHDRLGHHH